MVVRFNLGVTARGAPLASVLAACGPASNVDPPLPLPEPEVEAVAMGEPIVRPRLASGGDRLYAMVLGVADYLLVAAYDLEGGKLWASQTRRRVGAAVLDVSATGDVIWGGSSDDGEPQPLSELVAFDRDSGTELWRRGPFGDPVGNYVNLLSTHPVDPVAALATPVIVGVDELSADGMPKWSAPRDDQECAALRGIAVTEDGGLVSVRSNYPSEDCPFARFTRRGAGGEIMWTIDREPERDAVASAHEVVAAADDQFVIVGVDRSGEGNDTRTALGVGWIEVIDGEGGTVWRRYLERLAPSALDHVAVDALGYVVLGPMPIG